MVDTFQDTSVQLDQLRAPYPHDVYITNIRRGGLPQDLIFNQI